MFLRRIALLAIGLTFALTAAFAEVSTAGLLIP